MKRKWQTYYLYGDTKYPAQIVEAETKEIALMLCKTVEPYLDLGEEIIEQSHSEDVN